MPYKDPEQAREYSRLAVEKYRIRHPERVRTSLRKSKLKSTYGITPDDYDRMFKIQNGRCAICGSTRGNKRTGYLFVDHNHQTGEIRALLCGLCNTGLGNFRDNPDLLRAALRYLNGDC